MRIPVLAQILATPLIILWLIGYSTWYIGSLFYDKDHPRKKDSWYGFTEFKLQHQTAALLGTIATVLCFIVPTLLIPIAWLFAISNVFWAIGAHHKKNMPHTDDPDYSSDKQRIFDYLTFAVTTLSFITALTATALFFFPLSAPVLIPIATIVQVTVTAIIFGILIKYLTGDYKPDMVQQDDLKKPSVESSIGTRHETGNKPRPSCLPCYSNPLASPKQPLFTPSETIPSP